MHFYKIIWQRPLGPVYRAHRRLIDPYSRMYLLKVIINPSSRIIWSNSIIAPYSVIQKSERKERQRGDYFQYAQMGPGNEKWASR